jgi:biotin-dependent carboxylase-like uncharacterized protein
VSLMSKLEVIKSGVLTTVQDFGRFGYMQQGMTEGGAMDMYSAACANILCDNPKDCAVLEVTLGGFEARVDQDCDIAVTGAHLTVQINKQYVESWRTLRLHAGDVLRLGYAQQGVRAYIAVRGGWQVDCFFGSASCVLREGLGKALVSSDSVLFSPELAIHPRRICVSQRLKFSNKSVIRILPVQQYWQFSDSAKRAFFDSYFSISQQSDRMGYRLQGDAISYSGKQLISQALALGTVQIPPDGQPIIMMRDHQTMGGYPKIGCVLAADIDRLAQLQAGSQIIFRPVSYGQASQLDKVYNSRLENIEWQYVYG